MSKKIVFLSDLHLSLNNIERTQKFIELINFWKNNIDELYILGDFFDYWCGDEDMNEFINQIKSVLFDFTRKKPIYFIRGNHDFMIGNVFAKETGVFLLNDCHILELNNDRILLTHGDKFCTLDKSHQRLRFFVYNNNILKYFLRMLSLDMKYKIKERLEYKSKINYNTKSKETYLIVNRDIAKYAYIKKCNIIINGHTHTPGTYILEYNKKIIKRIEISDWADREPGGHILYENNQFNLLI